MSLLGLSHALLAGCLCVCRGLSDPAPLRVLSWSHSAFPHAALTVLVQGVAHPAPSLKSELRKFTEENLHNIKQHLNNSRTDPLYLHTKHTKTAST